MNVASQENFDFETKASHAVRVAVSDGSESVTATVTVTVTDSTTEYLCGDFTANPVPINGTANTRYFASGTGTQASPYVVSLRPGCRDITFVYDPDYQTSSPLVYFTFNNVAAGSYDLSGINVETLVAAEVVTFWAVTPVVTSPNPVGFFSTEAAGKRGSSFTATTISNGSLMLFIQGDATTGKWITRKGWQLLRQ